MNSSPNAPAKTIVKWPFFLGDGVLLATTVALLSLSERPLPGNVAAAAVVCVVLGIALALVPFLIENENRVRLAESSGSHADGHHLRKLSALAEQLSNSVSRSQSSTEQIERALTAAEESNDRLADLVENLGRNTDPTPAPAPDLSPVLEAISGLTAGLETIRTRLHELDRTPAATPADLTAALEGLSRKLEALNAGRQTPQNPTPGEPEPPVETEPPSTPTAPTAAEPPVKETKPRPRATPRVRAEPKKPAADDPNHALGIDIPESTGARYTFNDRSTSIIATAYVGIGNKLTIRGTGPGLSWEKGVPMQFLSDGKWGWSAVDVDEPIVCRIYRNDEEPSLDGDIELQPTELRELHPRF